MEDKRNASTKTAKAAPKRTTKRTEKIKKRDKIVVPAIILVVVIGIVVIILAVIFGKKVVDNVISPEDKNKEVGTDIVNTENVDVKEDGTKENNSTKLKEEKKFDGMKVKDIVLVAQGGLTNFTAKVENITTVKKGDKPIIIVFTNKAGEKVATLEGYLGGIAPSATTMIDASETSDLSNAYDFTIEYK